MRSGLVCGVAVGVFLGAIALSIAPASAGEIFAMKGTGTISEYDTYGATINTSLISASRLELIGASGNNLFAVNGSSPTTVGEYSTSGTIENAALITGAPFSPINFFTTSGDGLWGDGLNSQNVDSLMEWTTSGALVTSIPLPGTTSNGETSYQEPGAIAVSGGDVFLDFGTYVSEWTTAGTLVNASLITGLNSGGIAVSGSDIFVTHDTSGQITGAVDYVSEYTTSGTLVNPSLVTGLTEPNQLAIYAGDLFVADQAPSGRVIGEYTLAGDPVNTALISGPIFGSSELGPFVVVPEPATWILAVIGLVGLALVVCRRPTLSARAF